MAKSNQLGEPSIEFGVPEDGTSRSDPRVPTRTEMVRDIAVFQGKLVVDGLRDGMLMPVTLAAGVLGLISKNRRATRVFYDVLRLGQRTERWINLFHPVSGEELEDATRKLREARRLLAEERSLSSEVEERLDAVEMTLNDLKGADFISYRR